MTTAALLHIGVAGEALASTASFPDRPIDETLKNVDNEVKMIGFPTVMSPYSDTIAIVWQTDQPAVGWVEYGTDEKCLQKAESQQNGLAEFFQVHKVILKDLKPGTNYFYKACMETPVAQEVRPVFRTEVQQFKTLSSRAEKISFGIINDTHEHQGCWIKFSRSIKILNQIFYVGMVIRSMILLQKNRLLPHF